MDEIVMLITMTVTWIFGFIAKKFKVRTDLIPYQNLLIGLLVAVAYWIYDKNFHTAIAASGLIAGGVYDIFHNISKMEWYQKYVNKN